jgi:hypothetical protein
MRKRVGCHETDITLNATNVARSCAGIEIAALIKRGQSLRGGTVDAKTETILLLELDQAIEEFHQLRKRLQQTAAGVSISEEPGNEDLREARAVALEA